MYESTPGRESVWRIVRFFCESSQTRNRAYTRAPRKLTDRIRSVGRWLTIRAAGAASALTPEDAVALPLSVRAVTWTRSRKPTSAVRTVYVLLVAPAISLQLVPSASQRCHWKPNDVGLPVQLPVLAVSVCPTRAVPEIVGRSVSSALRSAVARSQSAQTVRSSSRQRSRL